MVQSCVVLAVALVLVAAPFVVAHDHSSCETTEHHCECCHLPLPALEPITVERRAPETALQDRLVGETQWLACSYVSRFSPPLRGPPVS